MNISKVISGGQTGVDRAALDVAIGLGIPCGGWCPQDRKAEDGTIDNRYPLCETPSQTYAQRTEWNVRDADATLILYHRPLSGGTLLTKELALGMRKPCFLAELADDEVVSSIVDWINSEQIRVLNVAGPRESGHPGIYEKASAILKQVFTSLSQETDPTSF